MNVDQKKQLIDAMFDEPGTIPAAASADQLRVSKILVETGSRHMRKPSAADIWRRHSRSQLQPTGKRLQFNRRALPVLAAAAIALFVLVILLRPAGEDTPPGQVTVRAETKRYKQAVQVFLNAASDYAVHEKADKIEFEARMLEARMDFRPTAEIKSVVIRTPTVTFRIIGTSIAISVTSDRAVLHVAEGTVQVEARGEMWLVTEKQVWSYTRGRQTQRDETEADRRHFIEMGKGKPVPEQHRSSDAAGKSLKPGAKQLPRFAEQEQVRVPDQMPAAGANKDTKSAQQQPLQNKTEVEDHERARADREARRAEREARRNERQEPKADKRR